MMARVGKTTVTRVEMVVEAETRDDQIVMAQSPVLIGIAEIAVVAGAIAIAETTVIDRIDDPEARTAEHGGGRRAQTGHAHVGELRTKYPKGHRFDPIELGTLCEL